MLLLEAVVLAFGAVAAFLVAQSITSPLRTLQQGADVVSGGDLGHPFETDAAGEVGALARAFARMTATLRDTIDEQRATAEELRQSHEELEKRVDERTADLQTVNLALKRSGDYSRSLIEASLDPLVTIGPDGRITDVNAATERATGSSRDELIGTDFSACFTEPERALAGYRQVFRDGSVRDYPLKVRHRDGLVTPVLYNAAVFRDELGQVAGVFAAARDVTRLRQAEKVLLDQAALLDLAHDAIIVRDLADTVVFWNRGAERTYGWTRSEALGRILHDLLTTHYPQPLEELKAQVIEEGSWEGELGHGCKDGSRIVVASRWALQRDERGQPHGFLEINRDVTDRKLAEEERERALANLTRSNAELEQFAYVASHDLQEPLRMISSYVQLLARRYRGQLDRDADDFIEFAVDGARRMQRMINDLLAFSRVETRGGPFERTELEEVLAAAMSNLQVAIEESGAVVTHDPLPAVYGDEGQLVQLVQNLLANAVKFRGKSAPAICVSATDSGVEWILAVRDNGIGIEPEYHERVFVIFQRLHGKGQYPGTGIGLAICKKIVERHGGRIWVEPVPGGGTTVYFSIPKREGS
jgi:PAS domain S-box-containing protein